MSRFLRRCCGRNSRRRKAIIRKDLAPICDIHQFNLSKCVGVRCTRNFVSRVNAGTELRGRGTGRLWQLRRLRMTTVVWARIHGLGDADGRRWVEPDVSVDACVTASEFVAAVSTCKLHGGPGFEQICGSRQCAHEAKGECAIGRILAEIRTQPMMKQKKKTLSWPEVSPVLHYRHTRPG